MDILNRIPNVFRVVFGSLVVMVVLVVVVIMIPSTSVFNQPQQQPQQLVGGAAAAVWSVVVAIALAQGGDDSEHSCAFDIMIGKLIISLLSIIPFFAGVHYTQIAYKRACRWIMGSRVSGWWSRQEAALAKEAAASQHSTAAAVEEQQQQQVRVVVPVEEWQQLIEILNDIDLQLAAVMKDKDINSGKKNCTPCRRVRFVEGLVTKVVIIKSRPRRVRFVKGFVTAVMDIESRPRRVRFIDGFVNKVMVIESHRSFSLEERLRTFSGKASLKAMAQQNIIEHFWERRWGRVAEEDEFYTDSSGRQWHPAHWSPAGGFNNDDNDSNSSHGSTSMSHDESLIGGHELIDDDDCDDDGDSLLVVSCGSPPAGGGDGAGDILPQTEPEQSSTSEPSTPSTTTGLPCVQEQAPKRRTRPFLPRRAKEGRKRYV